MANVVGLLASSIALLLTLNLVASAHLSIVWQALALVLLCTVNTVLWHRNLVAPMPFREAAKLFTIGLLVVAGLAAFDTFLGFAFGEHSITGAFFSSGPFGGLVDAYLFFCGLFVGVPTLVRSVYLFHNDPSN